MLGIGSLVLGGIQTIGGLIGLLSQKKPPMYSMSPDQQAVLAQAREASQQGFTGQERAAYESQVARQGATAYQRALDLSGGGMAQALSGSIGAANLGAANQMAIQDAALRRQGQQFYARMAGEQQRIQDMNVAAQQRESQQAQQSFGAAMQSGLTQIGSAANLGAEAKFMKENPGLYGLTDGTGTGTQGSGGVFNPKVLQGLYSPQSLFYK